MSEDKFAMSEDKNDKGWEYLQNDSEEGSFYEADGSWGSQNADGSWGTRNVAGSISYYGQDGTGGIKTQTAAVLIIAVLATMIAIMMLMEVPAMKILIVPVLTI